MRQIKYVMIDEQKFEVIRDFVNDKGTRYTRSTHSVGARFHDRWVHIYKMPDNMWAVAWHCVESNETAQFVLGDVTHVPISPVVAWHLAVANYKHFMLGQNPGDNWEVSDPEIHSVH